MSQYSTNNIVQNVSSREMLLEKMIQEKVTIKKNVLLVRPILEKMRLGKLGIKESTVQSFQGVILVICD